MDSPRVLRFPDCFGRNWDALEDCLQDLSWLTERGLRAAAARCRGFCGCGAREHASSLLEMLKVTADYWRGQRGRVFFLAASEMPTPACRCAGRHEVQDPGFGAGADSHADLEVLLIERADQPGFWQSVTGSQDPGETLTQTAQREVREETGIAAGRDELDDWQPAESLRDLPPLAQPLCARRHAQHRTCLRAAAAAAAGR